MYERTYTNSDRLDDIYFVPDKIAWICALVLPFVSGTLMKTKNVQINMNNAKSQNVIALPIVSFSGPNVCVTTKTKVQLNMTANAEATPLTSGANNSPIINHGIGPKPREKLTINNTTAPNGNHPIAVTFEPPSFM